VEETADLAVNITKWCEKKEERGYRQYVTAKEGRESKLRGTKKRHEDSGLKPAMRTHRESVSTG
jgi:hypothetical protein